MKRKLLAAAVATFYFWLAMVYVAGGMRDHSAMGLCSIPLIFLGAAALIFLPSWK